MRHISFRKTSIVCRKNWNQKVLCHQFCNYGTVWCYFVVMVKAGAAGSGRKGCLMERFLGKAHSGVCVLASGSHATKILKNQDGEYLGHSFLFIGLHFPSHSDFRKSRTDSSTHCNIMKNILAIVHYNNHIYTWNHIVSLEFTETFTAFYQWK